MFSAEGTGGTLRRAARDLNNHGNHFDCDNFRFEVRNHDTGLSVRIWVISGGKPVREIVNTTYWYFSQYCFNESKWESGAWDAALSTAITKLREEADKEENRRSAMAANLAAKNAATDAELKSQAEAIFTHYPPATP